MRFLNILPRTDETVVGPDHVHGPTFANPGLDCTERRLDKTAKTEYSDVQDSRPISWLIYIQVV
jgi:hypothetical protein